MDHILPRRDVEESKLDESYPSVEESKLDESYPSVEESKLDESYPSVEESKLDESYPSVEESKLDESYPSVEESKLDESYPSVEESKLDESYPSVEESKLDESYPSVEESKLDGSYPSIEESKLDESYPSIEESKLDGSYPSSQFMLEGFEEPFRRVRNANGGGILTFVREDIPCKQLKDHSLPEDIECIFLELNFRIFCGTCHPPNQKNAYYFEWLGKALDTYNAKYDKFIIWGDFNCEERSRSF